MQTINIYILAEISRIYLLTYTSSSVPTFPFGCPDTFPNSVFFLNLTSLAHNKKIITTTT